MWQMESIWSLQKGKSWIFIYCATIALKAIAAYYEL